MAISTGRPLLLIASMNPCSHCDNFEKLILSTDTFKNFVKENKIVVCATRDNNLLMYTNLAYRSGYGVIYNGAPHVYLFKVKEDADVATVNKNSFDKTQVELLKSTALDKYFAGSYIPGKNFMGIANGEEKSWNPSTFIKQIEACFPNQYWND